jgi:release factor glutamine methyltransferase
MVARRAEGLPLEHVLGWAEFLGLRIAVEPGVFVPRRRTEFLVREAAALLHRFGGAVSPAGGRPPPVGPAAGRSPAVVVDLCCGSGAVGAGVAAMVGRVDLYAVDIDPVAVRCARGNLTAYGGQVYQGDLYQPLPDTIRGRVDLLVVNAPYVPTEELRLLPPEARVHEPSVALDGGPDGLDVQRRVASESRHWLAPGGHLVIETSERQAPTTVAAFLRAGLAPRVAHAEELGATAVIGSAGSARTPVAPENPLS